MYFRVVAACALFVLALACAACGGKTPPDANTATAGVAAPGSAAGSSGNGGAGFAGSTPAGTGGAGGTAGGIVLPNDAGILLPDGAVVKATGPGAIVAAPADDAAFLWDDSMLRTFELTIAAADLNTIDSNPAAEQYVPGAFSVDGESVPDIGVRYKGSVGAFVGCTSSPNPLSPSGSKTCPKLSMKVSFDYSNPSGRFHGLKKLNFHSMNEDDSLMRDRLGYALFREMGLAAPRCVHARLLINGQFAGLFSLVEEIDGRFTDSRFTAPGDGNLYKEIWPKWTDAAAYKAALRTNKSNLMVSFDRVIRFATATGAAADDAAINALADQWLDMQYTMDFIAVDRTILNDDGMFHWYCNSGSLPVGNNPGACSNHNYYVYEEDHWDRLWLVEWDVTLAFRGETTGFTTIVDSWDATNVSCSPKAGALGILSQQMAPSCDKLVHGWAARQAEYKAAVRRFLDGPYSAASVDAKLSAWSAQISSVVNEAAAAGHQPSASTWQQQLSSLKSTIADLRSAAAARAP